MSTTTQKGRSGEDRACEFLSERGYKIVGRNVRKKGSELDIVAVKDGVYRFVEVKSGENFEPSLNLTAQKLKKVILGAQTYICLHKLSVPYCIDLVVIRGTECELYENVTM